MRLGPSRIILGIIALIVNIAVLSVFIIHLPLGGIPRRSEVIIALAPLDIIFAICIVFADEKYEEKVD